MTKMTLLEKSKILGVGFGSQYVGMLTVSGKNVYRDAVGKVSKELNLSKEEISSNLWILENAVTIKVPEIKVKETRGVIFHEFKNGDGLTISVDGKIHLVKKGGFNDPLEEKDEIKKFAYTLHSGFQTRTFLHNGEKVFINNPEGIINRLKEVSENSSIIITNALISYRDSDIYIDENNIYIPKNINNYKDICLLLSARNPISVNKLVDNCLVYKDTDITKEYILGIKKDVKRMVSGYGLNIKHTKLNISEKEDSILLHYVHKVKSKMEESKYNIFTI